MQKSYNGYYSSLPSWRRGFDSHLLLINEEILRSPLAGSVANTEQSAVVSNIVTGIKSKRL